MAMGRGARTTVPLWGQTFGIMLTVAAERISWAATTSIGTTVKRNPKTLILTVLLFGAVAMPYSAHAQKRVVTPASPQFAKQWDKKNFSHRLYDSLLRRHVKRGRVDYAGIRRYSMSLIREYWYRLANTDPARFQGGKQARLAFWINAYNALVLRLVLQKLPRKWSRYTFAVGGARVTLAQIRNKIIRGRFKNPRALFALVRAARGDPGLRARAYTGRKLDRRLRAVTRRYLKDTKRGVRLDTGRKIVFLPRLFKRYPKDFGRPPYKGVLSFVVAHLSDPKDAAFIKAHLARLTLQYRPYDSALNR